MRRRSGGLHCETEQQLMKLAENQQIGLFYKGGPYFRQVKFDQEWTIQSAQNQISQPEMDQTLNEELTQEQEQQRQLQRGTRYLQNFIVDNEIINCNIQICIITQKMDQLITKLVSRDSFLQLFFETKQTGSNSLSKHLTISSFPNSNVFSLETSDVETMKESNKENLKLSPKKWLKGTKADKILELLIVKKHTNICGNSENSSLHITIIHRIFIVNQKYLQNPLLKIYTQKCHFLIDTRGETLKLHNTADNQNTQHEQSLTRPIKTSLYNRLFNNGKSAIFDKECLIYKKGQFDSGKINKEAVLFKDVFHKLSPKIDKNYLGKIYDILGEQKTQKKRKQQK